MRNQFKTNRMKRVFTVLMVLTLGMQLFAQVKKPNVLWILTDDQRVDSNGESQWSNVVKGQTGKFKKSNVIK